ncbi:hypothetical protein PQB71_gp11 [Mycobacterium phage Taptic]|uniref:Uncharacterized protein n=1 Tax=Mycobacterium phage Taptic TaxID=1920305 RepID=A0A1J0MDR9_9CAUD|nr:hypothetical protein PQB71_gp11 [Mycobacterium phage Taptic]APD19241.1 hypothetical protein SEA_TAPTIC_11 [Mycobacterium phage Taptic]
MPAGVEVTVEDDVATVVFTDKKLRAQGVGALLEAGRPDQVQKITRPETGYVVPVEVARRAGFLDEAPAAEAPAAEVPAEAEAPEEPEGPSLSWSRDELNEHAAILGIENPESLPNKQAVLDAIHAVN